MCGTEGEQSLQILSVIIHSGLLWLRSHLVTYRARPDQGCWERGLESDGVCLNNGYHRENAYNDLSPEGSRSFSRNSGPKLSLLQEALASLYLKAGEISLERATCFREELLHVLTERREPAH